MSPYLRKEIRLLLPSFGVALALAFCVWLIPDDQRSHSGLRMLLAVLPIIFCPALGVMMALDSFGREIGGNTFSNLLAQPVPRAQVWWTKVALLAATLLAVFGVWWLSFLLHMPSTLTSAPDELHNTFMVTLMILVTAYSGGLWTVLLLRQVGAAFWITLLAPACLAMLTAYSTEKFAAGQHTERNVVTVLLLYSAAGFFWGRRLFLRAQDVAWTGGEIALPGWLRIPRVFLPAIKISGRRPRLALLAKEFQLHQSQLVIAGVLAILHIAILIARKASGGFKDSWVMEFVAFQFWTLWCFMPLLVGCAAVAEERKLGTLESQLCLPARRWTQFLIKFGVAFALAILFGVAMPALFEGGRILPNFHENIEAMGKDNEFIYFGKPALLLIELLKSAEPVLPFLPLTIFAVGFCCLAFYASTLTRNTLQSIAPAILGIIITWALLAGGALINDVVHYPLWRGWLIYAIGVPVMAVAVASLAWWNFKRVLVGWPVWRRNLAVFFSALALVIGVTTALYQRVWELLVRVEPAHGPARLTQSRISTYDFSGGRISVRLADGRTWSTRVTLSAENPYAMLLGGWKVKELHPGGQFLDGTNWQSVAYCARDTMAVRSDGTLWVSEADDYQTRYHSLRKHAPPTTQKLVRYGDESNWKSVVGAGLVADAIKNDGTLWVIGTNRYDWKQPWPGLRAFDARRLGTDSDWDEMFHHAGSHAYRKTDGRVYVWTQGSVSAGALLKQDNSFALERAPQFEGRKWRGVYWAISPRIGMINIGLAEEGKLWVLNDYERRVASRDGRLPGTQLGTETNWVSVVQSDQTICTLKADGTLWRWKFGADAGNPARDAKAERISRQSDWVGLSPGLGGVLALAADGSLWHWRLDQDFPDYVGNPLRFQPLLRGSRQPQLVGNIFAKAE
ncbi:MAG: ABC transporter permease [Verrucomicrobia bacterium]|nr:MAG: ABC transporter permease [Verrucomicrobiota bacterium]